MRLSKSLTENLQTGNIRPNECSGYGTKQSGGDAPILEFEGKSSTFSLLLLSGSLRTEGVVFVRVPSMGQIKIFDNFLYFK